MGVACVSRSPHGQAWLKRCCSESERLDGLRIEQCNGNRSASSRRGLDETAAGTVTLALSEDSCSRLTKPRVKCSRSSETPTTTRGRAEAIREALQTIDELDFVDGFHYRLTIVACVVEPTLESWILCLRGDRHAELTPAAAARTLKDAGVELKSTAAYVEIAKTGALPTHGCSLQRWLGDAEAAFDRLIDGVQG